MEKIKEELKVSFEVEVEPQKGLVPRPNVPTTRKVEKVRKFNLPKAKRRNETADDDANRVTSKEARNAVRSAPSAVCTICKREQSNTSGLDKDSWIMCDVCEMWFHLDCVELSEAPPEFTCKHCTL